MLTIAAPNTDRTLLTLPELRAAAGVIDGSQDAALTVLGDRISAAITKACRVERDGATPPTLRLETVSETIRLPWDHLRWHHWHRAVRQQHPLVLARRPLVSVTSVTEANTVLTSTDYELDKSAGLIYRLSSDCPSVWAGGKIVIVYSAGWAVVPDDLKLAATRFIVSEQQHAARDPLLKSKTIDGVGSYQWWVDPAVDTIVPGEVMDILQRGGFVNPMVA